MHFRGSTNLNIPVKVLLLLAAASFFAPSADGLLPHRTTLMKPRPLPVSALPKGSVTLAGALSPDGTRMALLLWQPSTPRNPTSSGMLQIEVLDAATLKPIATRKLGNQLPAWADYFPRFYSPQIPSAFFATYGPGGMVVVPSARQPGLCVLGGDTLKSVRSIPLRLDRPHYGPDNAEISPDGNKVAVAITHFESPEHGYFNLLQGGEIRVYSLETAGLLWSASFINVGVMDIAWSPDAARLAVTLFTGDRDSVRPREIKNVRVFDSRSGLEVLAFEAGPMAGAVLFGSRGEILTAPYAAVNRGRLKHDKVKVWGGQTGRLVREIGYPGRGVDGPLGASADGRVLLGYVGQNDIGFSWRAMEDELRGWKQKLAVWDARDGKLLASTPDIYVRAGSTPDECARTALSADGSRALLYWPCVSGHYPSPMLFDLPEVPLVERR